MGLFDDLKKGVKDAWGKGKCFAGFHKGEWKYLSDNKCDQEINCERCGINTRVEHEAFSKWKDDKKYQCWQVRHCKRCREKEERPNHEFHKERPKHSWDCYTFIKTCKKCGKEEEEKYHLPKHDWGSWQANPNIKNEMFRVCKRCKKRDFSEIKQKKN